MLIALSLLRISKKIIDWEVNFLLNLKLRELSDLIERETGYSYKTKYLKDWIGYSKCRENLRIRLPILMLFSRILENPEIVPKEYIWIEEACKTKNFGSLKQAYETRTNTRRSTKENKTTIG